MKDQKIALTYARSIYDLGKGANVDLGKQMTDFTEAVNSSNDLENALFLDLFTAEEKKAVVSDLFRRAKWSDILKNVVFYLIEEKRIGLLPLIFKELTVFEDNQKGFLKGVVEGREQTIDASIQKTLIDFLEKKLGKKITPVYVANPSISAGHKVTVGDLQLDATVEHQLDIFKQNILGES